MSRTVAPIAALGAEPAFRRRLHVAQLNLPPWDETETMFRGIFERRYYANHGPLTRQLDVELAATVGARHAVCVTNGTLALMLMISALELQGNEIIVPAFTFPATVQAILWAGATPVICDVNPQNHLMDASCVEPLITKRTRAILGVHLWGQACDPQGLGRLCSKHDLKLIYDACHAIGCAQDGMPLATFGNAAAYSLHATKVLNASEGGFIATDDDKLADRFRTARSFHPGETHVPEMLRFNAKMSEAQAAMALLGLRHLDANIQHNRASYERYRERLHSVDGLRLLDMPDTNNYQYIVLEVDKQAFGASRDGLAQDLRAENIVSQRHFWPGVHRMYPFDEMRLHMPETEQLCDGVMQLPVGQAISLADVDRVCDCIVAIQNARRIFPHDATERDACK